jgi:aryl-alcohol dehydrogenase-like predicted oxidoreductase
VLGEGNLVSVQNQAPVVIPIPGATRPESVIDSARAPELALTAAELAQLDRS